MDFALPREGELLPTRRHPWSYRISTEEALGTRLHPYRKWPLRLLEECPGVTWDMF